MLLLAGKFIGTELAAIGLAGVAAPAIGIGNIFGSYILGLSRNPSLEKEMFQAAILGLALTEAIVLFALMIAFLILYN